MKNKAFTLAETLIVMGIIGVVAALTLPNLNSSTGDKEKVAKVKKIYQNLNDAFGRATAVYGAFNQWCTNYSGDCQKRQGERITEFMKVSKVCGIGGGSCPIPTASHYLNENDYDEGVCDNDAYCVILADGTLVGFKECVSIDIDGPNKGTNTYGKDLFDFHYDNVDGIIPTGDFGTNCFRIGFCTKWVIMNDNMDYLNADSNGECKNSNVTLSETVISCK